MMTSLIASTLDKGKTFVTRHVVAFLVLTLFGCGTVAVNVNTDIQSPDDFTHTMEIVLTGFLAEMADEQMDEQFNAQELRDEGWDVTVERLEEGEDKKLVFKASRHFEGEEAAKLTSGEGLQLLQEELGFTLETKEFDGGIEYRVALNPQSGTEEADQEGDESISFDGEDAVDLGDFSEAFGEAMLDSFFQLNWTVSVPGEIVDTNADSYEGNQATWHLKGSDLVQAEEMYLVSRVEEGTGFLAGCNRQ
jgi:hypothetical protein